MLDCLFVVDVYCYAPVSLPLSLAHSAAQASPCPPLSLALSPLVMLTAALL